jgi:broad specificity phosphatase PhoE
VISSDETKAMQTAEILAVHLGLDVEVRSGIGENGRSSTGYLPPVEFEAMADRFFSEPGSSAAGWERAVDAQRRIVEGLADLLDDPVAMPSTVVVGHGAVGTLWYCWLTDQPIDRRHDQPGQGHYFAVDVATREVLHTWLPIDGPQIGVS